MTFELVQKPVGTLDLLLFLLRHGKTAVSAILSETGMNKESFYNAVERLKDLGFAYEEERVGYPRYVLVGLTRAGEAFARALGPAEEILTSTATSLQTDLVRLEAAGDPSTVRRRIEILSLLADREFNLGRWDPAESHASRLAELARSAGDFRRETVGLLVIGRVLQKRDRHDEAARTLSQAVERATAGGAHDLAAEAEYLLGSGLERRGDWARALETFRSAADRAGRAGDTTRRARLRQGVARILARQGRLNESLAILVEVVADFERAGAQDELPRTYVALGSTMYSLGRPEAAEWYGRAIDASRKVGDLRMEAYGLAYAAAGWIDADDLRRAEAGLARARAVFDLLGERTGLADVEINAGQVRVMQGRWNEADAHFDAALGIARETSNRYQEAWVLFNRGRMMKRRDRPSEARPLLEAAKRIFAELGSEARVAACDAELRDLTGS